MITFDGVTIALNNVVTRMKQVEQQKKTNWIVLAVVAGIIAFIVIKGK